jgi:hypothetical protein
VFDTKDRDSPLVVINLVDDPIGPTSRPPESGKFTLQLMPDPARVLTQGPEKELDDCCSDSCR